MIDSLNAKCITVDIERAILRYQTELGIELPKIVKQTFRLVMADTMKITAPKSQAQGRAAVKRDVNRAVYLLDWKKISKSRLRAAIQKQDYDAIRAIFSRMKKGQWNRFKQVGPFDPQQHRGARDQRGRVQRSKWVATADKKEHTKYVRAVQGHVGYTKSGWAPGSRLAGNNIPNWIARHTNPPGSACDLLAQPDKPQMAATHQGKTTENLPRYLINRAMEKRAKQMNKDVDQVAKGRASRYFNP